MSDFKDNFDIGDGSDDLQYDQFAFSFFITSILSILIVPLFVHILREIRK